MLLDGHTIHYATVQPGSFDVMAEGIGQLNFSSRSGIDGRNGFENVRSENIPSDNG